MGNFYTNFTIFGKDADSVIAIAKDLKRTAYVIDSPNHSAVLFDKECDGQDVNAIERLGADLSVRLFAPVFACLNHDDDHLLLWVFNKGGKALYRSCFDAPGFAWDLSRIRGGAVAYPLIVAVLGWPIVLFQIFRHQMLRSLLSLPHASVGFGYEYLSKGEIPPGLSKEDIKGI